MARFSVHDNTGMPRSQIITVPIRLASPARLAAPPRTPEDDPIRRRLVVHAPIRTSHLAHRGQQTLLPRLLSLIVSPAKHAGLADDGS